MFKWLSIFNKKYPLHDEYSREDIKMMSTPKLMNILKYDVIAVSTGQQIVTELLSRMVIYMEEHE